MVTKRIQMYKFCNSRSMHLHYVNTKPSTPGAANILLSQGNDCWVLHLVMFSSRKPEASAWLTGLDLSNLADINLILNPTDAKYQYTVLFLPMCVYTFTSNNKGNYREFFLSSQVHQLVLRCNFCLVKGMVSLPVYSGRFTEITKATHSASCLNLISKHWLLIMHSQSSKPWIFCLFKDSH